MAVEVTGGGLFFRSGLDPAGFLAGAEKIRQAIKDLSGSAGSLSEKIKSQNNEQQQSFSALEKAVIGFFSIRAASDFVNQLISVRGEFQKINAAFKTMLASKEKADELMKQAIKLAATTPFSLQEVATGSKQLLAYGFSADTLTETLKKLGNVSAGIAAPLNDIIYLYGTLKASGRVTQIDINQFAGRGIPIYEELAKVMGVAKEQVRELVSSGKIGFPQVEQAFNNMTNSGGMFYNLMEEQSKTLSGKISNLKDAWEQMLNKIGESGEGILSGGIQAAQSLIENYDKVLKILAVLIATYGAYKVALMLATVATSGMTAAETLHYAALIVAEKAQKLFNNTIKANPYVAAATAITAIISALILFGQSAGEAEKYQNQLNGQIEQGNDLIDQQEKKYRELSEKIKNKNTSEFEGRQLYQQIQQLYPQLFKNLTYEAFLKKDILEINKQIKASNDYAKVENIADAYKQALQDIEQISQDIRDLQQKAKTDPTEGSYNQIARLEEKLAAAKESAAGLNQKYREQKDLLNYSLMSEAKKIEYLKQQKTEIEKQIEATVTAIKTGGLDVFLKEMNLDRLKNDLIQVEEKLKVLTKTGQYAQKRSLKVIDHEIKILKDFQQNADNNADYSSHQKNITKLERERQKITGIAGETEQKRIELIKKVAEAQKSAHLAALGQNAKELEENKAKYQALLTKIEDFNKAAQKSGAKTIGREVIRQVKKLSAQEDSSIRYKQQTALQSIEFEKQKKLYADFEQYKSQYGQTEAEHRYGTEVKSYAKLLEEKKKQVSQLEKTASARPLYGFEDERLKQSKKQVEELSEKEQKRFETAAKAAETYQQQLVRINLAYQKQVRDLADGQGGKPDPKMVAMLRKKADEEIKDIKKKRALELSGYGELLENMSAMTKKEVLRRLKAAGETYKSEFKAGNISAKEYRDKLNEFNNLEIEVKGNFLGLNSLKQAFKELKEAKDQALSGGSNKLDAEQLRRNLTEKIGDAALQASHAIGVLGESLEALGVGGEELQGVFKNLQGAFQGVSFLAKGIAAGDPVQVVSGAVKLLTAAINLFNTKDKKIQRRIEAYKLQLESLQRSYKSLQKTVDNAPGDSVYEAQLQQIEKLQQTRQMLIQMRGEEASKKKADGGKIQEYTSAIEEIPDKIEEINRNISKGLLQADFRSISNSLADALTSAFEAGEDGIAAMNKSFNAFIANAIKNSLKLKIIEPVVKKMADELTEYAKNNNNSIKGFDFRKYKELLEEKGKLFNQGLLESAQFFNLADNSKQGELSKGIQGMSEQTANRLEAEFGGLRLAFMQTNAILTPIQTTVGQMFLLARQNLENAIKIESNTKRTADNTDRLTAIETALTSIDRKTIDNAALKRGAGI